MINDQIASMAVSLEAMRDSEVQHVWLHQPIVLDDGTVRAGPAAHVTVKVDLAVCRIFDALVAAGADPVEPPRTMEHMGSEWWRAAVRFAGMFVDISGPQHRRAT
jgi:hypothetical protein